MKIKFSSIKGYLKNQKKSWFGIFKNEKKKKLWPKVIILGIFIIFATIFSLAVEFTDDGITYVSEYITKDIRNELEAGLSLEKSLRENLELEIKILQGEQDEAKLHLNDLELKTEETDQAIEIMDAMIDESSLYSISSIIDDWKPITTQIYCDFGLYGGWGSGTAYRSSYDNSVRVYSNNHVIAKDGIYSPDFCLYWFSGNEKYYYVDDNFRIAGDGSDWGFISISNPDLYMLNITESQLPICITSPNLGDEIVILGYPIIGDADNVTATVGVISGFEGDYYITDAKIDSGNSGGTAILLKDNCWLGIPTYAKSGSVESLGRILDIGKIF